MSADSSNTLEEQQSKRQGIVWANERASPDATSTPTQFRHIEKFNILTLGGEGCVWEVWGVSGRQGVCLRGEGVSGW